MNVHLPNARNLSPADIHPVLGLRDSTDIIDDHAALDRRYEEDGYLFFRGLLDREAIAAARRRMMAPLLAEGLVKEDGEAVLWIGGDRPSLPEESPVFNGIVQDLVNHPANLAVFEKILGEAVSTVPMVQYRAYKPNNALGGVHQDGFYSPGILGYRPVWIPLVDMDEAMGGLTLAPRFNKNGYYHNTAAPPRCSIPEGVIPDDAWARSDYHPGDVLVIHPNTPHVGLPNRSKHVRMSIDTRVQSAANPATITGVLTSISNDSVTLACGDGKVRELHYDSGTFLRIGPMLAKRMTPEEFRADAVTGMALIASVEGDQALMIRRAHAG